MRVFLRIIILFFSLVWCQGAIAQEPKVCGADIKTADIKSSEDDEETSEKFESIDKPSKDTRCDVSTMAIAVRNGHGLRQIYSNWNGLNKKNIYMEANMPAKNEQELLFNNFVLNRDDYIYNDAEHYQDLFIKETIKRIEKRHDELNPNKDTPNITPVKLLIYAHGGKVKHESAVKSAEVLAPAMIKDGYVPVFLIWNSDEWISYGDALCCVTNAENNKSRSLNKNDGFLAYTGKKIFSATKISSDILSGTVSLPETTINQLVRFARSEYNEDDRFYLKLMDKKDDPNDLNDDYDTDYERLCKYFKDEEVCYKNIKLPYFEGKSFSFSHIINGGIIENSNKSGSAIFNQGDIGDAFAEFGSLVTSPIRGTVGNIVIHKPGTRAWNNMVRRTRLAFDTASLQTCFTLKTNGPLRNLNLNTNSNYENEENDRVCPRSGFSLFFDELNKKFPEMQEKVNCGLEINKSPEDQNNKVTTIPMTHKILIHNGKKICVTIEFYGHSMGAIIGNELLNKYPDLPISKVVYMAAASSIRNFKNLALPKIVKDKIDFHNVSLHPLRDSREHNFFTLVPRGSLLEWIDEMYEDPRSFDDRTLGKWKNLEFTLPQFHQDELKQLHVKVFPSQKYIGKNYDERAYVNNYCKGKDNSNGTIKACYPLKHGDFEKFTFWRNSFYSGLEKDINKVERKEPIYIEIKTEEICKDIDKLDAKAEEGELYHQYYYDCVYGKDAYKNQDGKRHNISTIEGKLSFLKPLGYIECRDIPNVARPSFKHVSLVLSDRGGNRDIVTCPKKRFPNSKNSTDYGNSKNPQLKKHKQDEIRKLNRFMKNALRNWVVRNTDDYKKSHPPRIP